jgi:hypothetical protein
MRVAFGFSNLIIGANPVENYKPLDVELVIKGVL